MTPNTTISHYVILQRLGAGGMGEVWLAEDTQLGRKVAIKLLKAESTIDEGATKRLIREAKSAATLDHPNICGIYEVGVADGRFFIAMQYVEGETLADLIQRTALELGELLDLAVQVADALGEAHSHRIIHRDIKPQNIMITNRGQAKVMDFGLAKVLSDQSISDETQSLLTEPGTIVGTVPYMSPELIKGESVDERSDIFSFGVVLYEMIGGRHPFHGGTAAATLSSILTIEPMPLLRYVSGLPDELQRIVSKALRKNREQRYQSIKDMLIDLKELKRELEFEAGMRRSVTPGAPESVVTKAVSTPQSATVGARSTDRGTTLANAPDTKPDDAVIKTNASRRRIAARPFAYAAVAVVAIAIIWLALRPILRPPASSKALDSLVVLPFTNGSADPNSEYLSDGITESIINSLSQVSDLKVIARTTSFRYKGKESDPQAVARELKVEGVLTGRVTQRGDSLLVQAELVSAADGTQLWGEKYSRQMSDILSVQEEIARQISERLRSKLTGEEAKRLSKSYTANTDAYRLYLQGRYYWNKRTEESYQKAIGYFQQAIERDRKYALAYTGLADCYSFLSSQGIRSAKDVFPLAKDAAERSIELDDTLAEAHTSLAYVRLYYEWDWRGAEQEYNRAIKLNPNYAVSHHVYAYLLISTGRTAEALAEIQKAQEIDPLSLVINTDYGEFYYFAHRTADAMAQLKKTIEMDPSFVRAHFLLGRAYAQNGQCNEAIAEFQKARSLESGVEMLGALAQGYASCGKSSEAKGVVDDLLQLSKQLYVSPHWLAATYAGIGDKDEAFKWLDKAFEMRFGPLIYLKVNPIWDPLRSDPRFAERLRRLGLAP